MGDKSDSWLACPGSVSLTRLWGRAFASRSLRCIVIMDGDMGRRSWKKLTEESRKLGPEAGSAEGAFRRVAEKGKSEALTLEDRSSKVGLRWGSTTSTECEPLITTGWTPFPIGSYRPAPAGGSDNWTTSCPDSGPKKRPFFADAEGDDPCGSFCVSANLICKFPRPPRMDLFSGESDGEDVIAPRFFLSEGRITVSERRCLLRDDSLLFVGDRFGDCWRFLVNALRMRELGVAISLEGVFAFLGVERPWPLSS